MIRKALNRFAEWVSEFSPRTHLTLALVLGLCAVSIPVRVTKVMGDGAYSFESVQVLPERALLVVLLFSLVVIFLRWYLGATQPVLARGLSNCTSFAFLALDHLWLREDLPYLSEVLFWFLVLLIPFALLIPLRLRWDGEWTPLRQESHGQYSPIPRWRQVVVAILFFGLFLGLWRVDALRLLPRSEGFSETGVYAFFAMGVMLLWLLTQAFKDKPESFWGDERESESRLSTLYKGGHRWYPPW